MRIWALLVLTACSGLRTNFDGGTGGGETGGQGGGSGGTGGGTGGAGGGASNQFHVGDAGTFAIQDITPTESLPPRYLRVFGTDKNNVVIGDSYGRFQRFDGNAWTMLFQVPQENEFTGLYVTPSGAIFASSGEDRVFWCPSACDQITSWNYEQYQGKTFAGLCGSGDTVYAVGHAVSDESGVVYRFNSVMNTWQQLSATNGATDYSDCAIASDGTLFIAAPNYVIEVKPSGDATRVKLQMSGLVTGWNAIEVLGDEVVMVGEEKSLARRSANGTWTLELDYPNLDAQGWTSLTAGAPGELIVGGLGSDTITNIGAMALVDATSITVLNEPFDFYVSDLWAADAHTLFIVGETHPNGLEPSVHVIYRLTR